MHAPAAAMLATLRTRLSSRAAAFSLALLFSVSAATDLALAQDGVVGWGRQVFDSRWNEQSFVAIAAGQFHTAAIRSDGSMVAWGHNNYDQCIVPALPSG